MKASEFRIGNYLYFLFKNDELVTKKATQLTAKQICKIDENDNSHDFWEPIPLTPEILEKCGMRLDVRIAEKDEVCSIADFCNIFYFDGGTCSLDFNPFASVAYINKETKDKYRVEIKFIHQLQNLYFTLTGTELQITL